MYVYMSVTLLFILLAYMSCPDVPVNSANVEFLTFRMPQCLVYVTHFAFS
jgi:hypothetical protein